jgi:predicted RND superfamily exporter protein
MSDRGSKTRDVRARMEAVFETWGHRAFRHRWPLLLGTFLVSALVIAQLPRLTVNNSTDEFLRPRDPIRVVYDDFRRRFGRDERITLAIETDEVFDLDFLSRLGALHEELEEGIPHVDEITSLVNARLTRGEGDELVVEELMEDTPEGPEGLALLRERVLSNPLYENIFVSTDHRVATIALRLDAFASGGGGLDAFEDLAGFDEAPSAAASAPVEFLSEEDSSEAVRTVREIVGRYQSPDFRIHMAGGPVITETMNAVTARDSISCLMLSLLVIGSLLFLLFRRLAAVVLPLLVVVLSMLCTLGIMAAVKAPMSVATQILPAFLVAVGVCDGVHILAIFYRRLEETHDKEEALAFTLGHSGLAILMTSITTAGGLISFVAGDLKPVADLGIWAPVGVILALLYTVILLPALIAVIPMGKARLHRASPRGDWVGRVLVGLGDFAAARPWGVVAAALVVLALSFAGTTRLSFSHDVMKWFPEDAPLRVATEFMNERLGGAMPMELVVESGRENGLYQPELLNRLEEVHRYLDGLERDDWSVSKTISLVDIVKETHQALNENRPDFYRIPQDRKLVAQELLLFENSGSDDLADFVDSQFSSARVTMRVPWMDAMFYPPIIVELKRGFRRILGADAAIEVTGLLPLLSRTFTATIESMTQSYVIALLVITPLMILLIGQFTRGLLSMIPNLTPVIMVLGYMGWTEIAIDGSNLMVGAIVIGLSVDDTIHFMHNFRRYYTQSGDARQAIHRTLQTTGRALLLTTLVLSAGFYVAATAYMTNMFTFGLLAGSAILIALLANLLLAPALMVLATRRERTRSTADRQEAPLVAGEVGGQGAASAHEIGDDGARHPRPGDQ